jgi:hypothetical protein
MLETFWKSKRANYRVILKSGADYRLSAENCKIKWNEATGSLISYEFIRPKGEVPFHCSPLEIAAILKLA